MSQGSAAPQQQLQLVLSAVNAVRALPSFRSAQPTSVAAAIALILSHDQQGFTPLHHAAATGNRELAAKVLAVLAHVKAPFSPVDVRDRSGRSALHWAVQRGQPQLIKDLLDAGASPNAEDGEGKSVLLYAIAACAEAPLERRAFFRDMVRFLLQCGADASAADQQGCSPVHAAAAVGDAELLAILVELGGAPVNLADNEGESALFYAVREGHLALLPQLARYGIDAGLVNESGESVVDFARSLGDASLAGKVQALLTTEAAPLKQQQADKMEISASPAGTASGLFSSAGAKAAIWSSNPAHLLGH